MRVYFITFRSVTLAQRGEGILRKHGMHCQIQRTPRWMEAQGCGYCLQLRTDDVAPAAALLKDSGVQFRRIYYQRPDGNVEEATV